MHEWVVFGVGSFLALLQLIGSGLIVRLLGKLDGLQEAKEQHAREIRDTRSAIARIEGHLDIEPFRYTE